MRWGKGLTPARTSKCAPTRSCACTLCGLCLHTLRCRPPRESTRHSALLHPMMILYDTTSLTGCIELSSIGPCTCLRNQRRHGSKEVDTRAWQEVARQHVGRPLHESEFVTCPRTSRCRTNKKKETQNIFINLIITTKNNLGRSHCGRHPRKLARHAPYHPTLRTKGLRARCFCLRREARSDAWTVALAEARWG